MQTKLFELRDRATFIPIAAVALNPSDYSLSESEAYLLHRGGYSPGLNIILFSLDGRGRAHSDPYDWRDRTFQVAHDYILDHWTHLNSGDVIDVEFILGETAAPKLSERLEGQAR